MKAIVLLSGGQDSTTCLYWAIKNFKEVQAIGFDYGQKHQYELECAKKICKDAGVEYKVLPLYHLLGNSALTNHDEDINSNHKDLKHLPASFVPMRNALFLTIATGYAFNNGIKNIVTGTCETDYSGYPDCRQIFINSLSVSLSLALDTDIKIHTPLMYLDKAQTWGLAKELDCLEVIIKDTMTDYNGSQTMNEWGRGELDNPASELRAKGYYKAKELKLI
jgi:7-cyano-7-deazaguanine synthase